MKQQHLIIGILLLTLWLTPPAKAQPTSEQILQNCATGETQILPTPFTDIPENHWAKEAVIKMYYCGSVRGPIAALELNKIQQQMPADINTLLSAPTSLTIENRQYNIETYLWRDFMPVSPPDGKPLNASITIIPTDNKTFPYARIDADRLWLLQDGQIIWETNLKNQGQSAAARQLEKTATNGPKLQPGTVVDVVIRLINHENKTYFIKAPQQIIQRTD